MSEQAVGAHYGRSDLWERIAAGLEAAGKNPQRLQVEDLAPFDQFHTRGREATIELAQMSGINAKADVLDAGGGIGGTARLLASMFGCHVTVLDLTDEFVNVGRRLTMATGQSEKVHFQTGSALEMPFPDNWFDYVVTQHSTMNIEDKERLYREVARVLRPGGKLAMHEVVAGANRPIYFPTMWASTPDINHLRTPEEMRAVITAAGLREVQWLDETAKALEFFAARAAAQAASGGQPPMGLQTVVGPDFAARAANFGRNLKENRVEVVQAVFEKPSVAR